MEAQNNEEQAISPVQEFILGRVANTLAYAPIVPQSERSPFSWHVSQVGLRSQQIPTVMAVINNYCKVVGITHEELKIRTRKKGILKHRQMVAHILVENKDSLRTTFEKIGLELNIHYSTVIHCHKAVSNDLETSRTYNAEYYFVCNQIKKEINIR